MTPDNELLHLYADREDEAAFAELVRRHLNLVYGLALRTLNGNAALAEDVTQSVFTDLARKAAQLRRHETIVGWLHTSTRFAAAKAIRTEVTRQHHEQEASAMQDPSPSADFSFAQLRPLLDEAVGALHDRERNAVLLRFFEDKSYREVGGILGISENGAQMRVERALEKLRAQFSRRGVTTTAALLSSALGAHGAVIPAPASLATSVVNQSLAGAAGTTAANSLLPKLSWPIWAGAGVFFVAALYLIFQQSLANGTLPASPNPSTSSSTMKPSQIIRSGAIASALLTTTSAATAQNSAQSVLQGTAPAPASAATADTATIAALVTANNRFAIDLFRQFNPKPNENAFFSPYSISTALAMTWAGAKGDTAAQMAKILHFSDMPNSSVLAGFAALQQVIAKAQTLDGAKLAIANSLWPEQNPEHPLLQNYLDAVQANFASSATPVDFIQHAPDAVKQINAWVEDKTNGKIKGLIQPTDVGPLTRLVLVNAIYFKGNWTNSFSPRANLDDFFQLANGGALPVVLMHNQQRTKYALITDGPIPCQILSLSYSANSRIGSVNPLHLSFVAILPHASQDLATLERALTAEQLASWLGKLTEREVSVYLPKFDLEERYPMVNTLQDLGVKNAFDSKLADFSGMNGTRELFISKVIHQTLISVDENGTVAAAATMGEGILLGSGPTAPPVEFRADHPFLFLIRDDLSGSILFLGQLASPTAVQPSAP